MSCAPLAVLGVLIGVAFAACGGDDEGVRPYELVRCRRAVFMRPPGYYRLPLALTLSEGAKRPLAGEQERS